MSNGEESHVQSIQMTFLMLPNELVYNCLGRVSRLFYPCISLVSKRFRSLLASHELYQSRSSFIGRTESCLYVALEFSTDTKPLRWFTLCRSPNSSRNILVPISSPNSPFDGKSGVVAVDSSIYAIGGKINKYASSRVMVMDCRSHTCCEAPSMRVARVSPSTCVVNGKIYVTGGCENTNSMNWIEVFDIKTRTWEFLQIPIEQIIRKGSKYKTVRYEGTLYVHSYEKHATYKLHKGKWRASDLALNNSGRWNSSCCVINNVFYCYDYGVIYWYDSNNRCWGFLKGLPRSFMSSRKRSDRLVDYGGKMVVLWEEFENTKRILWCAEIELERDQKGKMWGTLKWSDVVLKTNGQSSLVHALATTL